MFALISEIPFDLCFYGKLTAESQNVFFTLAGAACAVTILQHTGKWFRIPAVLLTGGAVLAAAELGHFDYGAGGVLLIWVLYAAGKSGRLRLLPAGILMLILWKGLQLYALLSLPLLFLYNGEKGRKTLPRYWFYLYYPAQLMGLYLVRLLWIS